MVEYMFKKKSEFRYYVLFFCLQFIHFNIITILFKHRVFFGKKSQICLFFLCFSTGCFVGDKLTNNLLTQLLNVTHFACFGQQIRLHYQNETPTPTPDHIRNSSLHLCDHILWLIIKPIYWFSACQNAKCCDIIFSFGRGSRLNWEQKFKKKSEENCKLMSQLSLNHMTMTYNFFHYLFTKTWTLLTCWINMRTVFCESMWRFKNFKCQMNKNKLQQKMKEIPSYKQSNGNTFQ